MYNKGSPVPSVHSAMPTPSEVLAYWIGASMLHIMVLGAVGHKLSCLGSLENDRPPASYGLPIMKSDTLSAIMMAVALVLARGISGITDASTTLNPSTPRTRHH